MKVAIVFRGGISKKSGGVESTGQMDVNSEFINYTCAYNSYKKHIIDANPGHEIDTFIHCWHPELEENITKLYNPTQIITEINSKYNAKILYKIAISNVRKSCYGVVSQAISMKKACEMASKYCTQRNFKYDLILIYRLDLLLTKDMIFEEYDLSTITCNNSNFLIGDFHFVMNYENMLNFSQMYDHFSENLKPLLHECARAYVITILGLPYKEDNILAGIDQEVVRKSINFVRNKQYSFEDLEKYGITREEILSYNS